MTRSAARGLVLVLTVAAAFSGCFASCDRVGPINPATQANQYFQKGVQAIYSEDYPEAIKYFELALQIEPFYTQAMAHLGHARSEIGQHDRAIQDLEAAIAWWPEYADSYYFLGQVYERKGDQASAEELWAQALEIYSSYGEVYFSRAKMREEQNRKPEALDDYLQAASMFAKETNEKPEKKLQHARAATAAGLLYLGDGRLDDAEKQFQIAVDTGVQIPEARYALGGVLVQREQWVEGLMELHRAHAVPKEQWYRPQDHEACKLAIRDVHAKAPKRVAKSLVKEGTKEYEKGKNANLELVNRLLLSATQIDKDEVEALVLRARLYLDHGEIDKAMALTQKALKADPRSREALYVLAMIHRVREQWKEAIDIGRRLRREDPRELKYHNLLGICYFKLKDLRLAEREWREALKCEGSEDEKKTINDNIAALMREPLIQKANQLNDQGVAALQNSQLDRARDLFKQAIQLDPAFAIAHANLAATALEQGDETYCVTKLKETLELDPDLHTAHMIKGHLYLRKKQGVLAKKAFQDARALRPDDPSPIVEIARIELEAGEFPEAQRTLEQAIALDPNHAPTYVLQGAVFRKMNLFDRSETSLKLAKDVSKGQFVPVYVELADLYMDQRKWRLGLEEAQAAKQVNPNEPEVWRAEAQALEALDEKGDAAVSWAQAGALYDVYARFEKAVDAFQRAVKLAPNNSNLRCLLGLALAKAGKPLDGIAEERNALQMDPQFLRPWIHMGEIYENMKDYDRAAAAFRTFIERFREPPPEPPEDEDQMPLYQQLCDAYSYARYRLASLYQPGRDKPVDKEEAVKLFREALRFANPTFRDTIRKALKDIGAN